MASKNIPCGCIKNYFNLDVSFTDCNHILIQDQSEWMQESGYTTPSSFDVTMTVEKWGASITKQISPFSSTTFSVEDFGLSCFGDDILCITTESCGIKYTRKKAMICGVECKIHGLIANADTDEKYEIANKLMIKLESVKINIEFERYDIATDLLETIKKQLKNLDCGSNCGCS